MEAKRRRVIGTEVLDASKNLGKELVNKILNTEKSAITDYLNETFTFVGDVCRKREFRPARKYGDIPL